MNINEKLYKKINACWMGKNIGGTLGAPFEGVMKKLDLKNFPDISGNGPIPNDDLDLQLVNLHTLEQRGAKVTVKDFSEEWLEHVYFPYDEYGYALTNLRRGLVPPLSGYYNNSFTDCMGSPIRSELWASVAAGRPDVAAYYAYNDALVDHAGGEGVYGEVFFAALESMAYFEDDIDLLIDKAIKYIPENCKTALALKDTLDWYRKGVSYEEIRECILNKYASPNFTDASQNIAFTMVGLLYGENFKDGLLKTVNLGYDTDCTVATLGAIYGILYGMDYIPNEWMSCVGENIKVSSEIQDLDYPKTIKELTERTVKIKKLLDLYEDPEFAYTPFDKFDCQELFFSQDSDKKSALKAIVTLKELPIINSSPDVEISLNFKNSTFGDWNFKVTLKDNNNEIIYSSSPIDLKQGNDIKFNVKLPINVNAFAICEYTVVIERLYEGRIWKKYEKKLALPVASEWYVDDEKKHGADGYIKIEGIGEHKANTILNVPFDRDIKFMIASSEPIKLMIDGETVIKTEENTAYIPAYHRGIKELRYIKHLTAGKHKIEFEIKNTKEFSDLSILPTAPDAGGYYSSDYLIDCFFGR